MTKTVYSLRISEEAKKMMEETDINWQEELRSLVEDRIRQIYKEKMLKQAKEIRESMKTSVLGSDLIREDRDER